MSVNTVEQALWEICNVPGCAVQMREHPDEFVKGRHLSAREQRMVLDLDVRALAAMEVNQMLIMMTFNILVGADKFPEYIQRLTGGSGTEPARASNGGT
jgi:hypothetical protein